MKRSITPKSFETPKLSSVRNRKPMALAKATGTLLKPVTPVGNAVGAALPEERISFKWVFPKAKEVFIAGSFNGWKASSTPLKDCGDGNWLLDLSLKPGRYEYRFVVDGKWTDDPVSPGCVPNPFGGHNCVLVVNIDNGKN